MLRKAAGVAVVCALLFATPAAAAGYDTVPFQTRATDGTALRGHVFLPRGVPRPLATVLHFSPYFGGYTYGLANTEQWASDSEISFLIDAGFAVAAVSMRGTGRSEGCLHFGDETDWTDTRSVIEALAAQPWSNGRIGMYGHSYPAWTQFMGAAVRAPALKAIVPTSGVTDVWNLLTRRGAALNTAGTSFTPLITAVTGHQPPYGIAHLLCPGIAKAIADNLDVSVSGDRTEFFTKRDLRERLVDNPVPTMTSIGIVSGFDDGHILQLEGMWARLRSDRTRFVLGQWAHETPTAHKPGWHEQVVEWFDHYLRDGPELVPPGVVEFQDDSMRWHTTYRWPPPSRTETLHLSGKALVPDGERVEPVNASFLSADTDPGLRLGGPPDPGNRVYASICGPQQALFVSRPLEENALLAGNFDVDLTLTNTLPGGNLSVFLWRTTGSGRCPDRSASWFGKALMDLRHWKTPGHSQNFPIGEPTRVSLESEPFAAAMHKGERIVVAIGSGSLELEPDPLHPLIQVSGGTVQLPVVTQEIRELLPPLRVRSLRALRVSVRPRRARAGRRTRFRFRVTALRRGRLRPVRGATIRFAGRRVRTSRRGRASVVVRFRRSGVRRVRVSKRGFRSKAVRVRVLRARR